MTLDAASDAAPAAPHPAVLPRARADRRWRILSLAPAVVLLLVLSVFPVLNLLGLSLLEVDWVGGEMLVDVVGLRNYRDLFAGEPLYWAAVRNTVIFAACAVFFQMLLGFFMALAVSRAGRVGRGVLTTVFLMPIVVPPIVIGSMWRLLMGRDFGLLNQLIARIGLDPVDWLGNPDIALASVIFVDVWHWTPFVFLLMLAGLESLDEEIYEAALLDTKSFWQELVHITIPLMMPTILVTLVFRVILSFKVFDEIYLLTSGGPGTATEVVNFTIYRVFFHQNRMGMGATMSVLTMFALAFAIILAHAFVRRHRQRGGGV